MLLQQLQLHNVESFMDNLWQEYQIHIQEGKNYQQKQKKVDKFIFFEVLDILFWGLKASPVAWTSFMVNNSSKL